MTLLEEIATSPVSRSRSSQDSSKPLLEAAKASSDWRDRAFRGSKTQVRASKNAVHPCTAPHDAGTGLPGEVRIAFSSAIRAHTRPDCETPPCSPEYTGARSTLGLCNRLFTQQTPIVQDEGGVTAAHGRHLPSDLAAGEA